MYSLDAVALLAHCVGAGVSGGDAGGRGGDGGDGGAKGGDGNDGGGGGAKGGGGGSGGGDAKKPVIRTASTSSYPATAVWIFTCATSTLPDSTTRSASPQLVVSLPENTTVLSPLVSISSMLDTNGAV